MENIRKFVGRKCMSATIISLERLHSTTWDWMIWTNGVDKKK